MKNAKSFATPRPGLPPEIRCELLPEFDGTGLEDVRRAFQSAVSLPFKQAWLPETEAGFSPGEVRIGWRGLSILVFAELTDVDIFNGATELNQSTWELGDVFEMFLQAGEKEGYFEFHVTPHNQRLQLHYPDAGAVGRALKNDGLAEFLIRDEVFHSKTWIETKRNRWHAYVEIPARAVCGSDRPIENTKWRFSFGRYDYTHGIEKPVISSTSSHSKPDFHRQHEWGMLTFKKRFMI